MLRSLRIDNFALIDNVRIDFNSGFTVITGETGSGKSILLNALNLILGDRANFSVIGNRKDKSVVEAEIDIRGFGLQGFFEEHDLDFFETTIVRRDIYKQGRSRAFINDTPVQLSTLKDFTSRLIHIHSQYNTLELKDVSFQMEILDILAGTIDLRHEYTIKYNKLMEKNQRLSELEDRLAENTTLSDYNQFQLKELISLDLDNVDYSGMLEEFKQIENSDELRAVLDAVSEQLEGSGGVIDVLQELQGVLRKNASYSSAIEGFGDRIQSIIIELKDISAESGDLLDNIESDPEKLLELSSRLDSYNNLLFKHRKQSQAELIELREELKESGKSNEEIELEITQLRSDIGQSKQELFELGDHLHKSRQKFIPEIEEKITKSLQDLKLKDTTLRFELTRLDDFRKSGLSELEMLFSPNAGFEPVPIQNAASGGELSRLMLALQNLVSKKVRLQTILFDEIDTGVSGDVAQKIGNMLKQMGETMQVIAITHLPQVAARGGQHLSVSKAVNNGITTTFVNELSDAERVEEIARLMSGDSINDAAILNAKELMSS
jgi:DNA repair protein RecN (Recombination protein N)